MQSTSGRPLGVTVIAILNVIGGIMMLLAGIAAVTAGALLPMVPQETLEEGIPGTGMEVLSGVSTSMLGGGAIVIGAIMIGLAIFSFIVAWGLLKGRGWAWTATVVLSVISLVFGVISVVTGNWFSLINVIISGIIIYYMYRPHVKAYFGKGISRGTAVGDSVA